MYLNKYAFHEANGKKGTGGLVSYKSHILGEKY